MIFKSGQSREQDPDLTLHSNNIKIDPIGESHAEKSIKFLGINLDDKLSWKYHINSINKKIANANFTINQMKNILPIRLLKNLYFALIHPHLLYGISLWGGCATKYIKKTITLQKRAIRTINKAKYNSHSEPLFKKCNILKLQDLHKQQIQLFMYDWKYSKLPKSFDNFFTYTHSVHPNITNRQSRDLLIQKPKNNFCANLPSFKFPKLWNDLKQELKEIRSKPSFKRKSVHHFVKNYSSDVQCNYSYCPKCSNL